MSEKEIYLPTRQVGVYCNHLPGSFADMRDFRRSLFAMIRKHGPPTYFVTLSAAESMWPETFYEIDPESFSYESFTKL